MFMVFKMTSNQVGVGSPVQQRALPSSIEDLTRSVTNLESVFYNLQSQLNPILDEELTEKANGVGQCVVSAPYHHSVQINDLTSRIRALSNIGNDLISRLHV
jgi:hypothetical protein